MLFPTTDFAIFFAVVFTLYWALNPYRRAWKSFILAASYAFYAWWDWRLVSLLALVSAIACLGAIWVEREDDERKRRHRTTLAVIALLLPLGWFKYYGFFAFSLTNAFEGIGISAPLPLLQIVLPIGICFYTFMAISYVVDISRLEIVSRPMARRVRVPRVLPSPGRGSHRAGGRAPSADPPARDSGGIDVSHAA